MFRFSRNRNVILTLTDRELSSVPSAYKRSLNILCQLIHSDKTTFQKIWSTDSNKPIHNEDGMLYFNNFTVCMTLCGRNCLPGHLYKLSLKSGREKTIDALVYSGPVLSLFSDNKKDYPRSFYRGFFLSLSADNWLCSYDRLTGSLLQEVYLGLPTSGYKFQHCDWDTYGEQIVLVSVLSNQSSVQECSKGKPNILATLAVFTVLPLEFRAKIEIERQVFGFDCNHVNVTDGIMIVGIGSSFKGSVYLYSFPEILKQSKLFDAKLNEPCDVLDSQMVGSYPAGIPLNCKLQEAPPVLFRVQCSGHIAHFGGYPWHYIAIPPRIEGFFHVRRVSDHCLAPNGILGYPYPEYEPDFATFHPDNSGRIIHRSAHYVRFYELHKSPSSNEPSVIQSFSMTFVGSRQIEASDTPRNPVNKRKRQCTVNSKTLNFCEKSIMSEDYEEELDLFSILGFDPKDVHCNGQVKMYDNVTGKLVKSLELGIQIDELNDYGLNICLDTLVIVERKPSSQYSCYVYKLDWTHLKPLSPCAITSKKKSRKKNG